MFGGNLLCFSLCPLSLVLSLDTTENRAPSPTHCLQLFIYIDEIPPEPSLLQAKQPQLSHPFLIGGTFQPLNHLSGPSLDLLQYVHISFVLRSPELHTALQVRPHQS